MIEVKDLEKKFGQFTAVDHISFQVEKGEIFGLLGPNGAGKTTTIRCLLTLIPPTSGSAEIDGIDVLRNSQSAREVCGYVPQDISVDGDLTGNENLLFYSRLFHIPSKIRGERIKEVLEFMELTEKADELARNYSGGMMRRLEIGQVLVNRPKVLFLDEPSIGLDPVAKRMVWDQIDRLRGEFGTTILLTTHDMNEADYLCDRIAIMNKGKIAVIGTPKGLKNDLGGDIVSITSADSSCADKLQRLGYELLPQLEEGICEITVQDGRRKIPEIVEQLRNLGVDTTSISLKERTLDDVFLRYAQTHIEEGAQTFRVTRAARRTSIRHGR